MLLNLLNQAKINLFIILFCCATYAHSAAILISDNRTIETNAFINTYYEGSADMAIRDMNGPFEYYDDNRGYYIDDLYVGVPTGVVAEGYAGQASSASTSNFSGSLTAYSIIDDPNGLLDEFDAVNSEVFYTIDFDLLSPHAYTLNGDFSVSGDLFVDTAITAGYVASLTLDTINLTTINTPFSLNGVLTPGSYQLLVAAEVFAGATEAGIVRADFNLQLTPLPVNASYDLFEIGELGGGASRAWAINNSGEVVGESKYSATGPGNPSPPKAVHWTAGTLIDIDYPDTRNAIANSINDNGQIVGETYTIATGTRAYAWQNDTAVDLGTLGGDASIAYANNNSNKVVGWSRLADGTSAAFLWSNGVMSQLQNLAGTTAHAFDINTDGVIVGDASVLSSYKGHAALWLNGLVTDLGTLGNVDGTSVASGINDLNQIVGTSMSPAGNFHAFLWENGTMTDLGVYANDTISGATDINNAGTIVGHSNSGAFIMENGVMTLLCDLVDCASLGWSILSRANGINERGDITGYGVLNGELKGFMLQAIPDAIIQWQVASSSVSEDGISITLDVTRSGNVDNVVSIDFITADGTASSPADYTADANTLSFTANVTSQTITINITDDNVIEPDETFFVALSNPLIASGGGSVKIGLNSTHTVTITNNDATSSDSGNSGGGGIIDPWMMFLPLITWIRIFLTKK